MPSCSSTRRWLLAAQFAALLAAGPVVATAQTAAQASAGIDPVAASLAAPLPAPIRQALADAQLPDTALSLWVQAVDGGAPSLRWHPDAPRQMASVMKLVTTGVALRTLGPAYTWTTALSLGGPLDRQGTLHGPLHLLASGDPSLDGMRLAAAVRQWRDQGLRSIHGDVLVDRSVFALPPHDPAAFDQQPLKPYNAGPDAWLLAHQAVSLRLQATGGHPGDARVSLSPALARVRLDARVPLAAQTPCSAWREALQLEISPPDAADERTVRVRGSYPAACGEALWPLLWPQATPGEHSARLFEAAWQEAGGRLRGQVREAPWPADAQVWSTWTSPPLAEVVRDINKFSNNVMARQLFLTLARGTPVLGGTPPPATLDQARTVVADHVRLATRPADGTAGPCEGEAFVVDNGSGLSRFETASARCMAAWIQVMWAAPTMPEWLSSLPVAGVDGTARRMRAATGQAHLKTGSIDGVAALAGIVLDARGRRHILVAVVNDPGAAQSRPLLQAVLAWVSQGAQGPQGLQGAP